MRYFSSTFNYLLLIFQKNLILLRQTACLTSSGKCKEQQPTHKFRKEVTTCTEQTTGALRMQK